VNWLSTRYDEFFKHGRCSAMTEVKAIKLDVDTINEVLKRLDQEIAKYPSWSREGIALWKFKEILSK
jgi:hypothetical protein